MIRNTVLFCSGLSKELKNKLGYFGDNSNVHGVSHVLSLKPISLYQRIFWLFILIASGVCSSVILVKVLALYSGDAVSYLIETDYLEFDTPFPAVTICEHLNTGGGASYERIRAYVLAHKYPPALITFFKETVFWNQKYCKACVDCTNTTCVKDFAGRVKSMRAQCNELLKDCSWGDKPFPCCERALACVNLFSEINLTFEVKSSGIKKIKFSDINLFLPLESEYGVCFTFNSRLTGNHSTFNINRRVGLPSLVFSATQEIGIRVHSPDDMVSVGMENILGRPVVLPLITDFELILKVEETISDGSVKTMAPHARGCLFQDERPAFAKHWPSDRYSYSTCVLYCRVYNQLQQCNCTHHLMPKMSGVPLCDIEGLRCLHEKSKDLKGTITCDCPMSCEEINYKPIHTFNEREVKPSPELSKRGTRGVVKMAQLPTSRVRRTAIRQLMGLVVDIGGVGGVFFGASLLSVIEIVYLCCMRRKK